jgi:hypothetical protein
MSVPQRRVGVDSIPQGGRNSPIVQEPAQKRKWKPLRSEYDERLHIVCEATQSVMLNEVKHLGREWNQPLSFAEPRSFANAQDDNLCMIGWGHFRCLIDSMSGLPGSAG